jgi:predicted amidophosphoribosyltransferase
MVCRNICQTIHTKIEVGQEMYFAGKKYCRRCEIFLYHNGMFCPCCGMQLRRSPTNKKGKERLRKSRQRRSKIMIITST